MYKSLEVSEGHYKDVWYPGVRQSGQRCGVHYECVVESVSLSCTLSHLSSFWEATAVSYGFWRYCAHLQVGHFARVRVYPEDKYLGMELLGQRVCHVCNFDGKWPIVHCKSCAIFHSPSHV